MSYSVEQVAERAGIGADYFGELVRFGIISPDSEGRFSEGDARRAGAVFALSRSGVPLDRFAAAISSGEVSLDFLDSPVYERFASLSTETFRDVGQRTGIPIELLKAIREALGSAEPGDADLVRDQELEIVPFVQMVLSEGSSLNSIERMVRVLGDSMRRVAETEADWYFNEILRPRLAKGLRGAEIEPENSDLIAARMDQALLAIYHGQQARTWMANFTRGIGGQLADAGLHTRTEKHPAICFLDVTGYTHLTQERGDAAAADLAEELARLVQRTSVQHGGRPIKWLGDGVMFFFEDPGSAVVAALDMVSGVAVSGLPPAHVGIHSGEVVFQQGDYFGQTVNLAARIADFARPKEVLVSQAVVEAAEEAPVAFSEIGPVELKGVSGAVRLFSAHKAA